MLNIDGLDDKALSFEMIRVGQAVLSIPGDWILVPSDIPGLVVATMPVDDVLWEAVWERHSIVPNLVVRFFRCAATDGGVALASADCTRDMLSTFVGSSLLGWDAFCTESGLCGREVVFSLFEAGVPITQWHWLVGADDSVIEITLTLPAGAHRDFADLGRVVAGSVRLVGSDEGAVNSISQIPRDRQDVIATKEFSESWGVDNVPLEKAAQVKEAGLYLADIPGGSHHDHDTVLELVHQMYRSGPLSDFSLKMHSGKLRYLESLGLVSRGELTETGQRFASVSATEPDLSGSGNVGFSKTTFAVWFDGDGAFMLIGPSAKDLHAGADGHFYLLHEHYRMAPAIIAAWSGLRATWPLSVAMTVSAESLEKFVTGSTFLGDPVLDVIDFEGHEGLQDEVTAGTWSFWSIDTARGGQAFRWVQTEQRGPLQVTLTEKGLLRLESFVPLDLHDLLIESIDRELVLKGDLAESRS
ncbi:hypothetical protein [Kocuria sp.]|uniref:hypothetical protein n=1 Tax=Kocuria sp. TaxID=1871328 RepID=UPI0026E0AD19|nr:hypothetical protein [Kocuria sp.]MDO5618751.1 hypothetical protein [Kocuria sp.]